MLVFPKRVFFQHVTFFPVAAWNLPATLLAGFEFTSYTHSALPVLPVIVLLLCSSTLLAALVHF